MRRTSRSWLLRIVPFACLLAWVTLPATGQSGAADRRVAELRRRSRQHPVLAARSDQRGQLQEPRDRLAVQDRQPRPAARVQPRVDAADGERRPLFHGRHAAGGRRARCGHRRAAVGAQRERRPARHQRAARPFRPRAGLLDRRPRRADSLRHARLPAHRAQREDRRPGCRLRPERRRRSEAGQRSGDRSRHRRGRAACDAAGDARTWSSSAPRIGPAASRAARPT